MPATPPELPPYVYFTPVTVGLNDGSTNAVLIISTNDPQVVRHLPLPEALYVSEDGKLGMCGSNVQTLDCRRLPEDWQQAAAPADGYQAQAMVCVVQEAIPHHPDEPPGWAPDAFPSAEPPQWAADVLAERYRIAARPVPVTIGGLAPIPAWRTPTTVEAWASRISGPN
ncbi:hypothetical protein [Kitasatospora sp. MBT63]|uniref:hypothetical protein n=1 Tax=Kitasatospora sp. MBT63 TaxID=1444768 RepID=UPI00053B1621|nr:hypothetical protein [Kitasatospora sp. MBT63]